jgi:hypothetical protein
MSPYVPFAEITANLCRAAVATLVGGPWPPKTPTFDLRGTRYATHAVSPPPFVALSALPNETAPPLQGLGSQTPFDTDGSLRRKVIRIGWSSQVLCPTCASRSKSPRQQRQDPEKAALESRLAVLSAKLLAVAAWPTVGSRFARDGKELGPQLEEAIAGERPRETAET